MRSRRCRLRVFAKGPTSRADDVALCTFLHGGGGGWLAALKGVRIVSQTCRLADRINGDFICSERNCGPSVPSVIVIITTMLIRERLLFSPNSPVPVAFCCKIKALRAKTNTYIKTPVRGEEPVFVVTGRKEDVAKAKREILSAAEHFSQIRASRKNNLAGLGSGASTPPGPPANIPGHVTIQVRVPYRVVGLVVGPKGATIKRIQHQTHTYIVTPSRDKEPVFEVTGLPESVEAARREIDAHIAMRTGNAAALGALPALGGLDDSDLIASLCKSGLNSILNYMEPTADTFPTMTSSTSSSGAFSSSGSCSSSSSSSSSGSRDLGTIWGSTDRDEGIGDSPSFETSTALSSIWSYPTVSAPARPSPTNSTSPADSLLSSSTKCLVCNDAKVTHALVPCGHNFFCMECANRLSESNDSQCPVCSMPAYQAIRIYSPNP
ncbi:hypothetical protein GWI33_011394 [Rhynchophorus ferrugineus]|uniref:RING-type domain-containing protein n=1 Tax=Rhynchophorus ferrugineus TaxID=354439 RepID=A0A834IWR1_RHYFE|nr:hypothetical protein GWI33_011394 [Rhynchophorus ferrugineus]